MKKFAMLLTMVFFLFLASSASALTITNGSFETGDLTGWSGFSINGTTGVISDSRPGPTDGNYYAELTGSASIMQAATWGVGETLSFDWNFFAGDELPYNDSAQFEILQTGVGLIEFVTLADILSTGDYGGFTGWQTYSYTFDSAGSGYYIFGVMNGLDDLVPSALYIDNVNSTPEPSSMLLMGAGILGFICYSRRRMTNKK